MSWYDEQCEGLGTKFLDALTQLLQRIESTPFQFPKIVGENEQRHLRHGVLRRFPYCVVFEVKDDQSLLILAVAHTSRDPNYWRNRPTA